jgi:uncharacterized protein YjiS (DUF1127 family)
VIRLADHSREPWATVYAILLIIKRTKKAMSDGDGYEHRFNCAGFIGTTGPAAVLKRWWVAYLTWRLQQTAIAQLKALSDRDLKDIGVRRCEIESVVKGGLKRECAFKS